MSRTDHEIRARLERAGASVSIDTEKALAGLHKSDARRARGRRVASLAIAAVLLSVIAFMIIWSVPDRGGFVKPGGDISGRLVFGLRAQQNGATTGLFVLDLETGVRTPVAPGFGSPTSAQWSPDGTRIAFTVEEDAGAKYALVVARLDGSAALKIVEHNKAEGTVGPDFISVAWSPDGTHLAYSGRTIARGRTVTVMSSDGGDARVLGGHWESVSWSPDGAHLLLLGWPDGAGREGRFDLYRARPDGSDLVRLTDDALTEFSATWSPDGSQIAFARADGPAKDGNVDVYVMHANGTNVLRLTHGASFDAVPVWAPDGTWIAFASDRGLTPQQHQANMSGALNGGASSIYVMRPDGSDVQLLFAAGSNVTFPLSWAG